MFKFLRQDDDIQVIRYFTALVDGKSCNKQKQYLRSLNTCSNIDITLGKFKKRELTCRVQSCTYQGSRIYKSMEEKRTDVAIAIQILDDAYQDLADRFVIISGDSDLIPAIEVLKQRFPEKQVIVYVPAKNKIRGQATELRSAADKDRTLPLDLIKRCQFPHTVKTLDGQEIEKPEGW